ncbi:hypothetical protein [Mucilaginibacter flavus]|uniref:hypothetical protein n=1 Tax=Mucilaginibacter flavus TaxID=931504 RepID=UPI0025B421F1|nr:hypothetical protein [Mucilaginibacter flavus]MDN3583898.1 hypothetical protein [Mucilaginibacter flavus]
MNIQAKKLNISQVIITSNRESNWVDSLSENQQKDVLEGLDQADRGEVVPHEEAVKLFGKWGLK